MSPALRLCGTLALLPVLLRCGTASPEPEVETGFWLSGDLHLHSHHSTDALDNRMEAIVPRAEGLGLDFFVVTDHDNHVGGVLTTWDDPHYRSDTMLMLYGVEWTTALGHANFFGTAQWDHAPLWALRDGDGQEIADAAHAQGLHFSINHPVGKDLWEYGFDHDFDSLEVWNAFYTFPNDTPKATELWDSLLATGRRITARGGSDCHHQEGTEARLFNVGNPTTWVHAEERSAEAVLEALARGRTSISYAPRAERVALYADADGDGRFELGMGDTVASVAGPIRLRVDIVGAREGATYTVLVVRDGEPLAEEVITGGRFELSDTPAAVGRTYYRAEVRGSTPEAPTLSRPLFGGVVGMTNPIYVGFE